MLDEVLTMKYRVNWTEYHSVDLEAPSEAEARGSSLKMNDTRKSVYAHEVHPEGSPNFPKDQEGMLEGTTSEC